MTPDSGRADGVEHSEFDDAMAGFRERARISNGARAEVIAQALQALLDGDLPEETRLTARAAAHSLAGSAGTFGFPLASRLGRDLEALLDTIDADSQAQARAGLEQVALLRQALAEPADPTDAGEPADPTDAGEPADPTDAGEPADPTDAGDAADSGAPPRSGRGGAAHG